MERGKKENIWKRKFFRQGRRRRMDKELRNIFVLSLSYFGFHFYIFIFIPSFEYWPQSVHTVQMFTEEENYDVNIVITSQKTCCTCDNNDQDNINNIDNKENDTVMTKINYNTHTHTYKHTKKESAHYLRLCWRLQDAVGCICKFVEVASTFQNFLERQKLWEIQGWQI